MYQHTINLGSQAKEEIPASAVRESEKDGKAGEKKQKGKVKTWPGIIRAKQNDNASQRHTLLLVQCPVICIKIRS